MLGFFASVSMLLRKTLDPAVGCDQVNYHHKICGKLAFFPHFAVLSTTAAAMEQLSFKSLTASNKCVKYKKMIDKSVSVGVHMELVDVCIYVCKE